MTSPDGTTDTSTTSNQIQNRNTNRNTNRNIAVEDFGAGVGNMMEWDYGGVIR